MGSRGYEIAGSLTYQPGEVILEIGAERDEGSTKWLARVGPPIWVVDVDPEACTRVARIPGVLAMEGLAEKALIGWSRPIRFAWLDGHDWPYEGPEYPPGCWDKQEAQYRARGQDYSQAASQASHLRIAELIADHVVSGGVVAFDDTWETSTGWDGKGGTAVPYLLDRGFDWVRTEVEQLELCRRP